MTTKVFCLAGCLLLAASCVKAPQNAKQTIAGMEQTQVLIAAQHALAEEGYDVEEFDAEKGLLKTEWKKREQGQIQYEIQVSPRGEAAVSMLEVSVTAKSKKKTTNGWSEPQDASTGDLESILKDIVEMVVSRYIPGETALSTPVQPKCESTEGCTPGMHCASGLCVSECTAASDCETGNICDPNGRCIPEPPPPCPAPAEETPAEETDDQSKNRQNKKKKGGDQ